MQARDPQSVVVYDKTLGNYDIMRNLTTGLLINGLTQSMLRRHVALDARDILLQIFQQDAASEELSR